VQALDFVNPRARPSVRELGEIGECRGAEIEQMLTLQVTAGPFDGAICMRDRHPGYR
jgi:hypothetical protein